MKAPRKAPGRRRYGRRHVTFGVASAIALFTWFGASRGRAARAADDAVPSPDAAMRRARAMLDRAVAAGDQAFGAVVVKEGRIVGEGPSRVATNGDPTAHAEMEAIRDAARRLGTRDLSGCEIYSTTKPCRMCETAAYWAGLDRMIYGGGMTDGGAPRYDAC